MTSEGGRRAQRRPAATQPTPKIRAACEGDRGFIRQLSQLVFSQFGDYATFLPTYLDEPAILTTVAELEHAPCGFLMMAFVLAEPGEGGAAQGAADQALIAEILAVAVAPDHHRKSIGRRLLVQALDFIEQYASSSQLSSLQLNVAHTNRQAMAFFKRMDFTVLKEDDGVYPEGQRSIRMSRPLLHED